MFKRSFVAHLSLVLFLCCLLFTVTPTESHTLIHGDMGTVGGTASSSSYTLQTTSMFPWKQEASTEYWHNLAVTALNNGIDFRDSLLLLGSTPGTDTPQGRML
ncbi:MAG: hypothetical protein D3917_10610, partial [Candidatus Electrothrix sp. AX5]|nr:hypothetical protein [Candidatus Electrothrix sp. AX5]